MTRAAHRHPEGQALDPLAQPPATTVKGANLKPGMVLLDDLGAPAAIIDHRIGSAGPKTGAVLYLVEDLDRGWVTVPFGENSRVTVAARS